MSADSDFWLARVEAVNARIIALETAVLQLTTGAVDSYTFDDGQTRQTVTRSSLKNLNDLIGALLSQRDVYMQRAGLAGPVYGRPGF